MFSAASRVALAVAKQLFDACSAMAASFELWHGRRLVGTSHAGPPQVVDAGSINAETQARVARHEELLLDSQWQIAKSKQLLQRTRRAAARTQSEPRPLA